MPYKSVIISLLAIFLSLLCSCTLVEDELLCANLTPEKLTITEAVTIPEYSVGDCTVWMDRGGWITLTDSSIINTMGEEGFSGLRRAIIFFDYKVNNLTYGDDHLVIIKDADLLACKSIPICPYYVPGRSEADDIAIDQASQPDCIGPIHTLGDVYVSVGYLNIHFAAMGDPMVLPTLTLVCDSVKSDEVFFRMLYNNHATSMSQTSLYLYLYSYPMSVLKESGVADSITLHLSGYVGDNPQYETLKRVARTDLSYLEHTTLNE